jgi:hypothetical protein
MSASGQKDIQHPSLHVQWTLMSGRSSGRRSLPLRAKTGNARPTITFTDPIWLTRWPMPCRRDDCMTATDCAAWSSAATGSIEDGASLASLLNTTSDDVPGLRRYETVRKPRATRLLDTSAANRTRT